MVLLQNLLRRLGVYDRLRASVVYDVYWRFADSRVLAQRVEDVAFYRRTLEGLRAGDLIFDIGANHGFKSDVFLRLGARVVAVEPDDTNQHKLRERFLKYRLGTKPITLVQKAVSDTSTPQRMWIDAPGSAKNTLSSKWVSTLRDDASRFGQRLTFESSEEVETTTIAELMDAHGPPFFIKIDVEGHEASVLRGMNAPVPFLSFEINLPEFRAEGRQCIDRLSEIDAAGEFNYTTPSQAALSLSSWHSRFEFLQIYEMIEDSSIEVFWRAQSPVRP